MVKRKTYYRFVIIIVLAVLSLAVAFSQNINQAIDFFQSQRIPILKALPYLPNIPFKLGLDLQGGSRLEYEANLKDIADAERKDTMAGLRDVIERRVNIFGVSEPIVSVQQVSGSYRLVVELPGVQDVEKAISIIGKTPFLEFRQEGSRPPTEIESATSAEDYFESTPLTGRYLKKASLGFDERTMEPEVLLEFSADGAKVFEELTGENVGKRLAIFIDNVLISAPRVNEKIAGGKAQITGSFTVQEARELARNLNAGALPVPIELVSENTIGPTLGLSYLQKSLKAGLWGFIAVVIFMIVFYRLGGFLASLSLLFYAGILLTLFKLIPVTLTLAGVGGAILSVGMAVDANILVFARQREEAKLGKSFLESVKEGFVRAWPSIRDSNFTTLLVGLIMFAFGTSFVKGFAVTLSLGILVSMFSALFVTKTLMMLFVGTRWEKKKWLW